MNELYIKGKKEFVRKIFELCREELGEGISIIDTMPILKEEE